MTTLAELLKTNIQIAFQTNSQDGGFSLCGQAITARYEKGDAYLCLTAYGIAGEIVNGELVDVMPSTQFDDFLQINYAGIDGLPKHPKTLWLNEFGQSELANNAEFAGVVIKMTNTLFRLAKNAKLLNKHPREEPTYPF